MRALSIMEADGNRGLERAGSVNTRSGFAAGNSQDHSRRPSKAPTCKDVGRMQRNPRLTPKGTRLGGAVIKIQMRESYRKGLRGPSAEAHSLSQVPHREGTGE